MVVPFAGPSHARKRKQFHQPVRFSAECHKSSSMTVFPPVSQRRVPVIDGINRFAGGPAPRAPRSSILVQPRRSFVEILIKMTIFLNTRLAKKSFKTNGFDINAHHRFWGRLLFTRLFFQLSCNR